MLIASTRYAPGLQYGDTVAVALDVGDAASERDAVGEPDGGSVALEVALAATLRVAVGVPMGWSHAMTTRPGASSLPAGAA